MTSRNKRAFQNANLMALTKTRKCETEKIINFLNKIIPDFMTKTREYEKLLELIRICYATKSFRVK